MYLFIPTMYFPKKCIQSKFHLLNFVTSSYKFRFQSKIFFLFHCSFSAVAAGMFNWPIIDLLQKKDELLEWTVHTFKCDKKERETWKVQCRSSKWKVYYIVYEKNMDITLWVCWFQSKLLRGGSTHGDLYVFVLLRFDL